MKPKLVLNYNKSMGGVDTSDQMCNSYSDLCKTCKWYKKLMCHISVLCETNSYIFYKETTKKTPSHLDFAIKLSQALVEKGIEQAPDRPMRKRAGRTSIKPALTHLTYRSSEHWSQYLQPAPNAKKQNPTKPCAVCKPAASGSHWQAGDKRPRPESRYLCPDCDVGLHPHCFKAYHTEKNYKQEP